MISLSWDTRPLEDPEAMRRSQSEQSAREKVGDGKLPNMYWVGVSNVFLTNIQNPGSNDYEASCDVFAYTHQAPNGNLWGPFSTYRDAHAFLDKLTDDMPWDNEYKEVQWNQVTIEDRLVGTIYEGIWREYYDTDESDEEPEASWDIIDDTRMVEEIMRERGAEFE